MTSLPLTILAGADRKGSQLPSWSRDKHSLTGAKGADIRIGGQPIVAVIAARMRQLGERFSAIYIAGPRAVFGALGLENVEIIDTDAGFAKNIGKAIAAVSARHPGSQQAWITCDVVPDVDELSAVLENYDQGAPFDLWFPLIEAPAPETLGASAWKPRYRLVADDGTARSVLPGHLAIFDPEAMELRLVLKLLELGYRTRNRPVLFRRAYFIRHLLFRLLVHDLLRWLRLRRGSTLWDVAGTGFPAARRLRDGTLTTAEMERTIRRMFTRRAHRQRHPERRVAMPILDAVSLARDIDTVEEVVAMGAESTS